MATKQEAGVIAGVGLAALVALGGYSIASRYSKEVLGDENAIFDAITQRFSQRDCITFVPNISENEILVFDSSDSTGDNQPHQPPAKTERLSFTFIESLADSHGLTVYDNSDSIESINISENVDEVLDSINSYTSNYHLEVSAPKVPVHYDANKYIPFNRDEYDLESFKRIGIGLTVALSAMPSEVFSLSNIHKIIIDGKNNFEGFGTEFISNKNPISFYNPYAENVYISLSANDKPGNFQRNLNVTFASAIDIEICGLFGAQFDNILEDIDQASREKGIDPEDTTQISYTLDSEIKSIAGKGKVVGNYLSPDPSSPISEASEEDRGLVYAQILRIDQHVPGYADFWENLSIEYS